MVNAVLTINKLTDNLFSVCTGLKICIFKRFSILFGYLLCQTEVFDYSDAFLHLSLRIITRLHFVKKACILRFSISVCLPMIESV